MHLCRTSGDRLGDVPSALSLVFSAESPSEEASTPSKALELSSRAKTASMSSELFGDNDADPSSLCRRGLGVSPPYFLMESILSLDEILPAHACSLSSKYFSISVWLKLVLRTRSLSVDIIPEVVGFLEMTGVLGADNGAGMLRDTAVRRNLFSPLLKLGLLKAKVLLFSIFLLLPGLGTKVGCLGSAVGLGRGDFKSLLDAFIALVGENVHSVS